LYIIGREGGRRGGGGRIEILNGRQQKKKKTDVALAFLAAIQFFPSFKQRWPVIVAAVRTFVNNNKNKKLSSSYGEVEQRKKEYIYKDE
jgi:ribosomal protein L23